MFGRIPGLNRNLKERSVKGVIKLWQMEAPSQNFVTYSKPPVLDMKVVDFGS